ncbi:MAG: ABC transporter permease [Spirochaetaceae bacterium]|jgi:spermidine/putrescine transport system permease protein|nr:ABC transporter permease [Spirochaetaceae bacterium]
MRRALKFSWIKKYGGILPVYLWMILLLVFPLVYIVFLSFMRQGETWGVLYEFNLGNYRKFADPLYQRIIANSFKMAAVCTVSCLLIGYPAAYQMAQLSRGWQKRVLTLFTLPFWTNALVRTYGWIVLLQKRGIINSILIKTGIIDEPLRLLYTNFAAALGMVYTLLPFMILPIYNSIEKIDPSLVEASLDLGGGWWQTFRKVTLRLSTPGNISGCLLVFMPSIGLFYLSDLMGGAGTMMIGNVIRNQFVEARNWPFGAALSVFMMGFAFILIQLYRKASGGREVELTL